MLSFNSNQYFFLNNNNSYNNKILELLCISGFEGFFGELTLTVGFAKIIGVGRWSMVNSSRP